MAEKENNNNQKQQLKEITERLEQGVKELFSSEKYMEYLRVMSQFHNYSFSNTLLIAMQKPEATLVAGYGAWQKKFERNVMKGEKAIKIFAPMPRKVEVERDRIDPDTKLPVLDENGEVQKEKVTVQQPHFKITSVFDVSQTDGKPLPELDAVHDLTADVEGYAILFEALRRTSKVPMGFEPIEGGSHGFYHQTEKRIAIAEGMSEAQNVKTGIHEIAHSRLHDRDMVDAGNGIMVDRRTREVQAESVAYTVCQHYGIETSEYSFGYIAGWSEGKELKELRSSMEVIRREANSMITEIDGHMEDIRREREQEAELANAVSAPSVEDVKALLSASHNQEADLLAASRAAFPNMDGSTLYDTLYGAAAEMLRKEADTLDVVELFGKEALFTNDRVAKNALPEGLYAYDLRGSDNDPGEPVTLEARVLVNHAGSVIVSEEIPIPENGTVPLGEDMSFTGESITMEQFYDRANPDKGAAVYHKDASEIAEKAIRFYLGNPDTMDDLGESREKILSSITDRLNEAYLAVGNTAKPKEQAIPPMSRLNFEQAKAQDKVDEWRASRKATESCAAEFDEKFGTAYHERRMPEFLTEMTEKYGMDRCMVVLASTIQLADHDGRYYPSTKADAAKVEIPGANTEDYTRDIRMSYRVNCHPVMVNSAFRVLWQMQQEQKQEKQAVTEKKSTVEQDARAEKPSLLNRLHDKQREVSNMTKQNPAKAQDRKRGVEI